MAYIPLTFKIRIGKGVEENPKEKNTQKKNTVMNIMTIQYTTLYIK